MVSKEEIKKRKRIERHDHCKCKPKIIEQRVMEHE
jgi:hypothetical protein